MRFGFPTTARRGRIVPVTALGNHQKVSTDSGADGLCELGTRPLRVASLNAREVNLPTEVTLLSSLCSLRFSSLRASHLCHKAPCYSLSPFPNCLCRLVTRIRLNHLRPHTLHRLDKPGFTPPLWRLRCGRRQWSHSLTSQHRCKALFDIHVRIVGSVTVPANGRLLAPQCVVGASTQTRAILVHAREAQRGQVWQAERPAARPGSAHVGLCGNGPEAQGAYRFKCKKMLYIRAATWDNDSTPERCAPGDGEENVRHQGDEREGVGGRDASQRLRARMQQA